MQNINHLIIIFLKQLYGFLSWDTSLTMYNRKLLDRFEEKFSVRPFHWCVQILLVEGALESPGLRLGYCMIVIKSCFTWKPFSYLFIKPPCGDRFFWKYLLPSKTLNTWYACNQVNNTLEIISSYVLYLISYYVLSLFKFDMPLREQCDTLGNLRFHVILWYLRFPNGISFYNLS